MKKGIHTLLCIGLIVIVSACHKQYLRGYYSRESFLSACEWKKKIDSRYHPSEKWMDSLRTLNQKADVRIYLGTYCPDSRKWVPRFFFLQDSLLLGSLEIVSVDTTKKDVKGQAQAEGIKKIPTFIFYREGNECGRITEKPRGRIEKALYRELKKCE